MNTETLVGIAASIGTGVSLVPQLLKVLKEKKAEDLSLGMLAVLFAGLGLWIAYGFLKKDIIIIVANCFSFIINIALAIFSLKYKQKS